MSALGTDIIDAQEEIYAELRDQAMALEHQSVYVQRQIEVVQAQVSWRNFDESCFVSSNVKMRASEASEPLNMAYLPAILDLPVLHFKDLPQEMPEIVIKLI